MSFINLEEGDWNIYNNFFNFSPLFDISANA